MRCTWVCFSLFTLSEQQVKGSSDDVPPLRWGIKAKVELRSPDGHRLRLVGVCGSF
jgi:hypothetical protein